MDKGTIIRTIALVVALLNQVLTMFNLNPVPGSYEIWYEVVTVTITVGASVWCWFRNNYLSARGRKQLKVLQEKGLTNVK